MSIQLTSKQRTLLYSMDALFAKLLTHSSRPYSPELILQVRGIIQNICINDKYEVHDKDLLNHIRTEYIRFSSQFENA